jgi:poly-gamma-glutamate biosynthesis protein PgsC/CapC
MYHYTFDVELIRMAIVGGIMVSMLFYDRYQVTAGGALVPGYLALFVPQPTYILTTLLIAVGTTCVVQQLLRPRYMLWGRQLLEAEIVVTLALQVLVFWLLHTAAVQIPMLLAVQGIGFVLPAMIAHEMGRQGMRTTLGAASLCMLTVFGFIMLIGACRNILGLYTTSQPAPTPELGVYAFPVCWLLVAVIMSVLASIVLDHRGLLRSSIMFESLRTGGFVTAGYVALFLNRPLDLLFLIVCSVMTYVLVTKVFMEQAILFGRSKSSVMFLTGMLVTWGGELLLRTSGAAYVPWLGFAAIAPTIVALLANDTQRQGPWRTTIGVTISAAVVLGVVTALRVGYTAVLACLG